MNELGLYVVFYVGALAFTIIYGFIIVLALSMFRHIKKVLYGKFTKENHPNG